MASGEYFDTAESISNYNLSASLKSNAKIISGGENKDLVGDVDEKPEVYNLMRLSF